eukprot:gnl/MRDRNA2_/MRDRNA2_76806_c0_seq2.p1 gnl/MRDRNA2_/MRDRNA2_76806_c0~~gnl/MRDRNA2_/MRDRNA2_76806_c0_seq2.p1  ORF type:complete len:189 (+),score=29.84 gnl/MRDRNA2_/MRDRNA2_76806_c0_seq2:109-675(+)
MALASEDWKCCAPNEDFTAGQDELPSTPSGNIEVNTISSSRSKGERDADLGALRSSRTLSSTRAEASMSGEPQEKGWWSNLGFIGVVLGRTDASTNHVKQNGATGQQVSSTTEIEASTAPCSTSGRQPQQRACSGACDLADEGMEQVVDCCRERPVPLYNHRDVRKLKHPLSSHQLDNYVTARSSSDV